MGRFLSVLGSVAFLAVQLYELQQRYKAERRAERDEALQLELLALAHERARHLARIADAFEEQGQTSMKIAEAFLINNEK